MPKICRTLEQIRSAWWKTFRIKDHGYKTHCWDSIKGKNHKGYPRCIYNKKVHLGGRLSWLLFRGKIPKGKLVLHRCDNRACVNPEHLFLGTALDNMRDCVKKGRIARGEKHGSCKLSSGDVIAIRSMIESNNFTMVQISNLFNVTAPTIFNIKHNKTWRHIYKAQ